MCSLSIGFLGGAKGKLRFYWIGLCVRGCCAFLCCPGSQLLFISFLVAENFAARGKEGLTGCVCLGASCRRLFFLSSFSVPLSFPDVRGKLREIFGGRGMHVWSLQWGDAGQDLCWSHHSITPFLILTYLPFLFFLPFIYLFIYNLLVFILFFKKNFYKFF